MEANNEQTDFSDLVDCLFEVGPSRGLWRLDAERRFDHPFQARDALAQLPLAVALRSDLARETLVEPIYALALSTNETRESDGGGDNGNEFSGHGSSVEW